jgi:hypothetical protein
MSPPDLLTILRSKNEILRDAKLTFKPPPGDSTLIVGSNGHRYPANRVPRVIRRRNSNPTTYATHRMLLEERKAVRAKLLV